MSMEQYNNRYAIIRLVNTARKDYEHSKSSSTAMIDSIENTLNTKFDRDSLRWAVDNNYMTKPSGTSRHYILL